MNDPRIPNIASAHRVQNKTSPANETMGALSVSRTLELLAADMNAYPEWIVPVEMRLVTRIISVVGQLDVDLNSSLFAEDE